jgi:hypothetical protein
MLAVLETVVLAVTVAPDTVEEFVFSLLEICYCLHSKGCFTRGGTRHFVNNSDTNKDIATKFGVDLPQFM